MANLSKSPKIPGFKPAVRQDRGPGMNLGLKKPRFGMKKVKPVKAAELKEDKQKKPGSLIPMPKMTSRAR